MKEKPQTERVEALWNRCVKLDEEGQLAVKYYLFGYLGASLSGGDINTIEAWVERQENIQENIEVSECCEAEVVAGGRPGDGNEIDVCSNCGRPTDPITIKRWMIDEKEI